MGQLAARPWLAFVLLFAFLFILGPYDLHYRADHEVTDVNFKTAVSESGATIAEGRPLRRVATVGLMLFALVLLARGRRGPGKAIEAPLGQDRAISYPIIAFLLLAALSFTWAEDPPLVLKRVAVFWTLCLTAYAVGRAWRFSDILLFTVLACGATLTASVGLDVAHGMFHPLDGMYRLSGLAQPNAHAIECAFVILASLAAIRLSPEHKLLYLTAIGGAAIALLLTHSRTSVLSLAAALACGAFYTVPRRQLVAIGIPVAALVLIIAVSGIDVGDSLRHALLFGRTATSADIGTLTGRTELWAELLTYARTRPLLGFGFASFWSPKHSADISIKLGWLIAHAHNGYLAVLLDMGAVGLTLFVGALLAGIAHALRQLRADRSNVEALFTLCLLVWTMTAMFAETVIPQTHYVSFIPMIFLARQAVTAPVPAIKRVYMPVMSYTT